jgi:hypothetical protein
MDARAATPSEGMGSPTGWVFRFRFVIARDVDKLV